MNIESEGDKSFISSYDREETKTPERKPNTGYHYLTLTEKCKAYVEAREGKNPVIIAKEMGRNLKTIKDLVKKGQKRRSLENQHAKKGRFPKGSINVKDEHKRFILKSLEEGTHNSTNEIFLHIQSIKKLPKLGYGSVLKT